MMKKNNLKMLALGLIAALAITSCGVHRDHRRPPRHDRHHDRDHDRHDGDHYYRNY